ncbi:Uncharacterised protein [Klebsiella pneumoniae]|nr:Uncharacterised protein [Klebsiella pneumoniae]
MKITTQTLAISEGWMLNRPKPIQRIEPFTSRPIPGVITSTSRPKATSNSFQPQRCQVAIGTIMVRPQEIRPITR